MSEPSEPRPCEIFTRARKASTVKTTSPMTTVANEATSGMANIADVLAELKSLRSDFGSKLDHIDNRLSDMVNSVAVIESKLSDVERDVSANTTRIGETETRIATIEDELQHTRDALASATKRIAYLESKTEDLENRGRRKNLRLFGLRERAEGNKPLFDFVNDMLPRWLGCPDKTFTLERVHRTLAPARPNQNRAILVRFLKFQEKEFVFRETRKREIMHDDVKLSFSQDLSAETVRIRRGFVPVVKQFVAMGTFRGFQHNPCKLRVLHDGRIHLFSTPQEAEKFHQDITRSA